MTDEQAKDPRATPPPVEPARPASEAADPSESTLPADGDEAQPEETAASPTPSESSAVEAEGDAEVQSKFDRPASSLGIRPPVEQSKTARPPSGLGPLPRPAATPTLPAAPTPPAPTPPAASPSPAVRPSPAAPPRPVAAAPLGEDAEAPEVVPTWAERFRRLSPALVILGIGSFGALGFLVFAMTSHTTPVAVLLSAGVVVTLAFLADTVIASIATWRAAVWDEDPGRALLLAVVAGGSAIVCAGALGATTVLLLLII